MLRRLIKKRHQANNPCNKPVFCVTLGESPEFDETALVCDAGGPELIPAAFCNTTDTMSCNHK